MACQKKTRLSGRSGREHVVNYNFETFNKTWVNLMLGYEEEGSWETRKYKNYRLLE